MDKKFEDKYDEEIFNYIDALFNKSNNVKSDSTGQFVNEHVSINLSTIESILIESAGRYCDRYASDILITRDSMVEYINEKVSDDYDYFVFAMRKHGADGKSYLHERAKQYDTGYLSQFYRQIYICKVEHIGNDVKVTMKEIGDVCHVE